MSSWSRLQEHAVILPWILVLVVVAVVAIGVATAPHPLPAECDQNLPAAHALLPCDTAVRLSVAALAIDHAPVNRVQFGYGSARPWECGLPVAIPRVCSYVVFTFADGSRQYVAVQWQQDRFLVATRTTWSPTTASMPRSCRLPTCSATGSLRSSRRTSPDEPAL